MTGTTQTAILTGAASRRGIGRTTARRLAREGWALGLLDLDERSVVELAAELTAELGVPAVGVGADLADEASVRDAVDRLEAALPPIRALANVAGVSSPAPYLELTSAEWHRTIDIDLHGVHYVCRRVAESLVRGGAGGRIVVLSSVSAQRGGGTYSKAAYSAAKAGVLGLARSLARELGRYDITVNSIAPGPIDTDIMGGTLSDERKRAMAADLVVNRIGTPDDVAAAIAFLLGPDSGYISGQTINVDGGLHML